MTPSPLPLQVHATVTGSTQDPAAVWVSLIAAGAAVAGIVVGWVLNEYSARRRDDRDDAARRQARLEELADRRATQHEVALREIQDIVLEQNADLIRLVAARQTIRVAAWWVGRALKVSANCAKLATIGTRSFDEELGTLIDAANRLSHACIEGPQKGLDDRIEAAIAAQAAVANRAGDLLRDLYGVETVDLNRPTS